MPVSPVHGETRRPLAPHLDCAVDRFNALDMRLWESAARRRLGEVTGGSKGHDLMARADAWMIGQAIRNPARMTATLCPGFPDSD